MGSLIERIGRIVGIGSEGSIGGWRAEMGVGQLVRRPDREIVSSAKAMKLTS